MVATTPKTLISDGGFVCTYGAWVSDPAGGPYSGLLIVAYGNRVDAGVCDDDKIIPDDLVPGQVLKVVGFPKEFCLDPSSHIPVYPCPGDSAVTELKLVDGGAQVLGTAPNVAPTIVDPTTIGSPGADNAEWDGVLIQAKPDDGGFMSVTNDNPDSPGYFGNWILDSHLWLSHQFRYDSEPFLGDQYKCATGVWYFKDGNWKIEPRSDRDLGGPYY